MARRERETPGQRELRAIATLAEWVRSELYSVREGAQRAAATTAVAAAAAEETYRVTDRLPDLQNETSASWRAMLPRVWALLEGDRSQHVELSRAVGVFLLSPLNHADGQDGPNDFDRPQTVAAYSAALSAIAWGVDFAVTAVVQMFEAIDVAYEGADERDGRWDEVQREIELVRRLVASVVSATRDGGELDASVLRSVRSG